MKKIIQHPARVQYAAAGKKKFIHYMSFKKKDAIIRNIEIIVACVVAFVVGTGLYNILK